MVEDDSALEGQSRSLTEPALNRLGEQLGNDAHPTQALLIGWNDRAPIVLRELDRYAPPGSTLTVLTAFGEPVVPPTTNLAVTVVNASSTVARGPRPARDRRRSTRSSCSATTATSRRRPPTRGPWSRCCTCATSCARSGRTTPVVSEMLDDRNRVLASVADVDDVVVSGEIVSACWSPSCPRTAGSSRSSRSCWAPRAARSTCGRPSWYVQPGDDVSWATVVAGAARRNETAIGLKSELLAEPGLKFGVVVNPPKSQTYTISAGDARRGAGRGLSTPPVVLRWNS